MKSSLQSMTDWALATHAGADSRAATALRHTDLSTSTSAAAIAERKRINHGHATRASFTHSFPDARSFENAELQRVARGLYDADAPHPVAAPLAPLSQAAHLANLQGIHANPALPVTIHPQSDDGHAVKRDPMTYFNAVGLDAAAGEFAYRMKPAAARGHSHARVTLNFQPSHAGAVAEAMARELAANPRVTQAKMMGPARLGQRTDDAILYMGHQSFGDAIFSARLTKARLAAYGHSDAMVTHSPFGMEPLPRLPGFSYAETAPGMSSSHGNARKPIIAAAVMGFRDITAESGSAGHRATAAENMAGHVGYQAYRAGLNPGAPAFAVTAAHTATLAAIRDPATHQAFHERNAVRRTAQLTGTSTAQATTFRQALLRRYGM